VSPLDGIPPPNHDTGMVMASLHPWNLFLHLMGHSSILEGVLFLDDEDFLVREEDVFVPVLCVPLEKPLCSSVRFPSN